MLRKYEIVKLIDQGAKQSEIAKRFDVNESTVSRIKKNKDLVAKEFESGLSSVLSKRKKLFDLHSVDKALLEWFKLNAGQSGLVGSILQEKAIQFAGMLGFNEEFQIRIDINWINRFKARHSIVAKKIHGESVSAPLEQVCKWKEIILLGIMQEFELGNIFNVDETGLFWKLLQFKGMYCKGGKHAKDRITELVGASALGEKLP